MANIKISELNELDVVSNDDVLPIVDVDANETKKVKTSNLKTKIRNIKTNSNDDAYSCNYINDIFKESSGDFNNVITTTIGKLATMTSNTPTGLNFFGTIVCIKYSDNYCTQLAMDVNTNNVYYRALTNSAWSSWKTLSLKGVILYDTTGSNETNITLNDDISNYNYVEIFYKVIPDGTVASTKQSSVRAVVATPIILESSVSGYFENSYYGIRTYSTSVTISGNTLNKPVGYNVSFSASNTVSFNDKKNDIYITRVIGYKTL